MHGSTARQLADLPALLVDRWPSLRKEPRAAWHALRAMAAAGPIETTFEALAVDWGVALSSARRRVARLETLGLVRTRPTLAGLAIAVIEPRPEDVPAPAHRPRLVGQADPQLSLDFGDEPPDPPRIHTEAKPVQAEKRNRYRFEAPKRNRFDAQSGTGSASTPENIPISAHTRAPADVDVRRVRSSTSDDHKETERTATDWAAARDTARRIADKIAPRPRPPLAKADRSLVLKAAALIQSRLPENTLWDAVEAVVRTKNGRPWAYLHRTLANQYWDLAGCHPAADQADRRLVLDHFNALLRTVHIPAALIEPKPRAP